MKRTVALIDRLLALAHGEALPSSSLRGDWFQQMLADGILVTITRGSRKSYRATDEQTFRSYLASQYDIRNLEDYRELLSAEDADRAIQVNVSGYSKLIHHRTFGGFLVNCYVPIHATLDGNPLTILPAEGTYLFITEWQYFEIPEDVIVVGIENSENFRHIARQRSFFESEISKESPLLFVSRYPLQQEKDLVRWLQTIPNRYVHFGDLDLAGIAIYQNEFYRYLGERSSFLIPHDFEERIANGNRHLYDAQFAQYGNLVAEDKRITQLIECIHRHHRGYEQEGFISE